MFLDQPGTLRTARSSGRPPLSPGAEGRDYTSGGRATGAGHRFVAVLLWLSEPA